MNKLFLLVLLFFIFPLFVTAQICTNNDQRPCGASDIGECRLGTQICENGQWSICYGGKEPTPEVCGDNKDNDCDGETDEQCECEHGQQRSCGDNNVGICTYGTQTCVDGVWGSCVNETKPLPTELCDNKLDDDCDGDVDEGCKLKTNNTPKPPLQRSTCFNNVQDGDETGVDCGGSCKTCAACTDGIKNQGELNIKLDLGGGNISDCGGPHCPPCPTCTDKIRNQGELDVDCGGPCKPCEQKEKDSDEDGLTDAVELQQGTNPNKKDTDNDGQLDSVDKLPLCPNNFCDEFRGETTDNCPQDCTLPSSFPIVTFIVVLLVIIAVFAGYFYYQFKKTSTVFADKQRPTTSRPQGKRYFFNPNAYSQTGKQQRKSKLDKQLEQSLKKAKTVFKK